MGKNGTKIQKMTPTKKFTFEEAISQRCLARARQGSSMVVNARPKVFRTAQALPTIDDLGHGTNALLLLAAPEVVDF